MAGESHHVDALLLALASSTDNFMVGISMGMGRKRSDVPPLYANGIISVCNAGGAYLASQGGLWVKHSFYAEQRFSLYLSSLAFGALSFLEYRGYCDTVRTKNVKVQDQHDGVDPSSSGQNHGGHSCPPQVPRFGLSVWKLAIPMTLNNFAGGVVGGASGVTPELLALYALFVSFGTMWVGYGVGQRVKLVVLTTGSWLHPSFLSAALLGILCLMTLREAFVG
jgi:putative Mn2+ efflux pump MntP